MSFTHIESASLKPSKIFWPLLVLGIVLAADVAAALVFLTIGFMTNVLIFCLVAPAAALLVGIPAYFRFIATSRYPTIKRGVLVGIVSSIIAHPVMWLLLFLAALFVPQSGANLSLSLWLIPFLSVFSLIYGGWATTAIGALAGMLLIMLQRALMRAQQQQVRREAEAIQRREISSAEAEQTEPGVEDMHS